ncbi:hypothetical protein ANTQUA_LOCUS7931 [Anthophora quadrimaculata]
MDDIEQQCEDAVFELCDARERYPLRCADELKKSIKLKSDINMLKVCQKSSLIDEQFSLELNKNLYINLDENKICFDQLGYRLQNVISKLDNLKAVMDQIDREKTCLINKLLEG